MEDSLPSSGLVLVAHPLEISASCIQNKIIAIKSWVNVFEIDLEAVAKGNLDEFDFSNYSAVFLDLTKIIYHNNCDKNEILNFIRRMDRLFNKKTVPVFALLRNQLLCNDYLYLIPRAIMITESETRVVSEERFAEPTDNYYVSILTKPSSGKLEIDDRFEFTVSAGFKFRTIKFHGSKTSELTPSPSKMPVSTFNLGTGKQNDQKIESDAKIFVEDSDRDSDDEMEADADF